MLAAKSLDTKKGLTAFIDAAEKLNACAEALVYLRACAKEGLTLRGAVEAVHARLGPQTARSFALWVRTEMDGVLPDEIAAQITKQATSGDDCDHEATARLLMMSGKVDPKGDELARLNALRRKA